MRHTYIVSSRNNVIMVTVTIDSNAPYVRIQENAYEIGTHETRAYAARWLRYWRRCGWTIRRVV